MIRRALWRAVVDDIEALTLPNRQRFKLLKWERDAIRGFMSDDVSTGAISLPRKNGKSGLSGGLAISALAGALVVPTSDVVLVASSFDQAKIIFDDVRRMIRPRIEAEPQRWQVIDHSNRARIHDRQNDVTLKCIGSDPRRAHGLRPSLTIGDEIAQWGPTADKMIAALSTAGGLWRTRMLCIGTRPADSNQAFGRWLDSADYSVVYAADPEADPLNWRTYAACNPSWRAFPFLRDAIKNEIAQAKRDPSMIPQLRALRGNAGVSDTVEAMLIDPETWRRCERPPERKSRPVWGIDLGSGAAMSAVAAYWPLTGALEALGAFPCVPGLVERGALDGVAGLYEQCAQRGELVTVGNRVTDIAMLLTEALRRYGRPAAIVADRYRERELRDALDVVGFPQADLVFRGQGFRDGGEDVRTFRLAAIGEQIAASESLLIRSALSEARVAHDPAGNVKLAKAGEGGRRARARDDVAAAIILCVAEGRRRASRPPRKRKYYGVAEAAG